MQRLFSKAHQILKRARQVWLFVVLTQIKKGICSLKAQRAYFYTELDGKFFGERSMGCTRFRESVCIINPCAKRCNMRLQICTTVVLGTKKPLFSSGFCDTKLSYVNFVLF